MPIQKAATIVLYGHGVLSMLLLFIAGEALTREASLAVDSWRGLLLPSPWLLETFLRYGFYMLMLFSLVMVLLPAKKYDTQSVDMYVPTARALKPKPILLLPIIFVPVLWIAYMLLPFVYALSLIAAASLYLTYLGFLRYFHLSGVHMASGQDRAHIFQFYASCLVLLFIVVVMMKYVPLTVIDTTLSPLLSVGINEILGVVYIVSAVWLSMALLRRRRSLILKRCGNILLAITALLLSFWLVSWLFVTQLLFDIVAPVVYISHIITLSYVKFVVRGT